MGRLLGVSTALAGLAAVMAAASAAVNAGGGEGGRLYPRPRVLPAVCTCEEDMFGLDEGVARCQLASDFLIALAYFSIPLELLYFFLRSNVFPHRWVLLQFGAFIVLCGLTHMVSIWTYGPHSRSVAITQTILKILTAAVSCATAFLLVRIIPALLNIKVRELFLQHKAAQLDREMGVIKRQEEVGRHVRMLTHEIRSTLDRHTILNTTLVELARMLALDNCTVWMPDPTSSHLELTHELERRLVQVPVRVPLSDPVVQMVITNPQAVKIPDDCALACASAPRGTAECPMAAVRLPLLQVYDFTKSSTTDAGEVGYAVLVMAVSAESRREWKQHDMEMVEVVADQVAVALSHAAVLEESQKTRDALVEQNHALQIARQKAETAVRARNDFLAVMNHEMRTPLQAVIAVASILQEAGLASEQSPMVETILKSSSLLATLINDVLEFSRLEEGCLTLESKPFELLGLFHEAGRLAWPMARGKGLDFSLQLQENLPTAVLGDEKRLLQTVLNVLGNAVRNTSMDKGGTDKGSVTLKVGLDEPEEQRASRQPVSAGRHVNIRIEVNYTGRGLSEAEAPGQSHQLDLRNGTNGGSDYIGTGLGLAICQKFVELMEGHIWRSSEGEGSGSTITVVVRLQVDPQGRRKEDPGSLTETFERELAGLRIMVVDDNKVNRMAEQAMLETLGCDVVAVESAVDGLSELGARGNLPFDAVLLDICMPEIDGSGLAQEVMHMFRPDERPLLIALTARTDKAMRNLCLEIGMDAVLRKPISLRELGMALVELVQANTQ